jgi:hypothetical protein
LSEPAELKKQLEEVYLDLKDVLAQQHPRGNEGALLPQEEYLANVDAS